MLHSLAQNKRFKLKLLALPDTAVLPLQIKLTVKVQHERRDIAKDQHR